MGIREYVRTTIKVAEMEHQKRERRAGPLAPPPCPTGWHIGPPDFVGVGVQKAGTSWWSRAVFSHPDILPPVRKEIRFFQHHWYEEFTDARVTEYHRYFPRPDRGVTGEWTPNYMMDQWTARRLYQAAPEARILVILRDPVARLRSGVRHIAYHEYGHPHPRLVSEAIEFGRYAEQLTRLASHFPRSQILVLQYERCVTDPDGELAKTYDFIGVDSAFVPKELHDRVNESEGPAVPVPSDLLDVARGLYLADVELLRRQWPEIDLGLWPGVAGS
jgi:hypothetical protein